MSFDYNTERPQLKQPEYGRIIQKMVDYCLQEIPNKEERTKVAKSIINIMASTNSQLHGAADFRQKIYDHLAIMSDFKLDIDWEFELPNKENIEKKPNLLYYSDNNIKFRHYGKFTEEMLNKINSFENEDERNILIELIANNMKRLYYLWKKEQVSDDVIFNEMKKLSDNSFTIPENLVLIDIKDLINNGFNPVQNQKPSSKLKEKNNLKKKNNKNNNGNI